jgi:hypothetical protein
MALSSGVSNRHFSLRSAGLTGLRRGLVAARLTGLRRNLAVALLLGACDVPAPSGSTGGTEVVPSACGAGIAVASSDYTSSSVALLGLDGRVTSGAILSSGTQVAGLSTTLSHDVVLPGVAPASGQVVLLDRGSNVITWLDPASGAVTGQLSVAAGFKDANPHDYLELSATRAYVTRYSRNRAPGAMPLDQSGDVLVINPQTRTLVSSVDLGESAPHQPRPERMQRVGASVWLTLGRLDDDFQKAEDGRIIGIDPATDATRWSLDLPGVYNCSALAYEEKSGLVAVACSGVVADKEHELEHAAIVLLDASHEPPTEKLRVAGPTLGDPPPPGGASSLAFADEHRLLVSLAGSLDAGRPDRLVSLSTTDGSLTEIHRASTAFVLGDITCAAACTGRCFLADADAGGVRSLLVTPTAIQDGGLTAIPESRGLPPRNLGRYGAPTTGP